MAQNFIACDREQELMLPPSLREWLPQDHLAWFVLDAVDALDLAAFFGAYRSDGHGRAARDPAMMVALLVYAYAVGERSSRRIERRCHEDVATRVICANRAPDHTTIARFRQRHETALGELFGGVLELCAEAGLVAAMWSRSTARRCMPTRRSTRRATTSRSRARSSNRPRKSMRSKTSSSASGAAMSCRRSSRPRKGDSGG